MSYRDRLHLIKLGELPKEAIAKKKQYISRLPKEKRTNDRGLFVREKQPENNKVFSAYELDKWFKARRSEMTGKCMDCSKKTAKDIDHLYKFSICHIIPKSPTNGCPSVATNEHNWIELCIDHHSEFDNTFERAMKMKVWDLAKRKAKTFLHLIPQNEYKKFLEHFK